ncbi:hypothetical protein [Streptomyces cucumeris]|uniref:hypothetical protein n=1 Tax=Streptomyces cucumeris TaxID=2962890 RepID=UPI0020C8C9C9|nr:hypothetical protein [Streptomyces sp. NEAU-Y11]MCP9211187.1 hypothetical protein [Streptomyces sp. NEAU-Y11]
MKGFDKLRRCTEKDGNAVDFCRYLAAAIAMLRTPTRCSIPQYSREKRSTTRRLK